MCVFGTFLFFSFTFFGGVFVFLFFGFLSFPFFSDSAREKKRSSFFSISSQSFGVRQKKVVGVIAKIVLGPLDLKLFRISKRTPGVDFSVLNSFVNECCDLIIYK